MWLEHTRVEMRLRTWMYAPGSILLNVVLVYTPCLMASMKFATV